MTEPKRILVGLRMPPLIADLRGARQIPAGADLSRLGRLAACLAALALPAIGVVAADRVHRVAVPGAMQAAAPGFPSRQAAAYDGASRAGNPVREALLITSNWDWRR
ncbi:hypothetical protein ACFZ8E_02860 [Methylobacterium sp. HMF5984]|uniref:hypothetical protein n=1 Tax=Methylobacterium sp. HMF5984 TaxID=3367370 RepID=UPI003853EB3A